MTRKAWDRLEVALAAILLAALLIASFFLGCVPVEKVALKPDTKADIEAEAEVTGVGIANKEEGDQEAETHTDTTLTDSPDATVTNVSFTWQNGAWQATVAGLVLLAAFLLRGHLINGEARDDLIKAVEWASQGAKKGTPEGDMAAKLKLFIKGGKNPAIDRRVAKLFPKDDKP